MTDPELPEPLRRIEELYGERLLGLNMLARATRTLLRLFVWVAIGVIALALTRVLAGTPLLVVSVAASSLLGVVLLTNLVAVVMSARQLRPMVGGVGWWRFLVSAPVVAPERLPEWCETHGYVFRLIRR